MQRRERFLVPISRQLPPWVSARYVGAAKKPACQLFLLLPLGERIFEPRQRQLREPGQVECRSDVFVDDDGGGDAVAWPGRPLAVRAARVPPSPEERGGASGLHHHPTTTKGAAAFPTRPRSPSSLACKGSFSLSFTNCNHAKAVSGIGGEHEPPDP